jgi:fructokinase
VRESALALVARAHAICFGSLAQRCDVSRRTIHTLLDAANDQALRIFDINLRQQFYSRAVIEASLARANVLKVNDAELPVLADMFALRGDARAQMTALASRFDLRAVACTRGARGSLLLADGEWAEHPGVRTPVADTVGAGDAFTAAMTLGLLAHWNVDEVNRRANEVAAYVASQHGATPELPQEVRAPFLAI